MEMYKNGTAESIPFTQRKILEESRECLSAESDRIAETGERFISYFMKNASADGVLFKTIKEITTEMNIPHQTLSRVLKALEDKKIIYRRNGIIGIWKQ